MKSCNPTTEESREVLSPNKSQIEPRITKSTEKTPSQNEKEEDGEAFQCKKCAKYFKNKPYLYLHQQNCPPKIRCRKCLKSFKSNYFLILHQKSCTANIKGFQGFQCELCLQFFKSENFFKLHMNVCVGEPIENSESDIINVSFSNKKTENKEKVEIEKQMQEEAQLCDYCDKAFANSKELKIHMVSHNVETIDSEVKQEVICDKCCKVFDSMKSLKFHINDAHQKEETKKLESPMNKTKTKDFEAAQPSPAQPEKQALLCDKCFECFESKENLDLHIKSSHTKSYNIVYQKDSISDYKERYSPLYTTPIESVSLILILFRYFPLDK